MDAPIVAVTVFRDGARVQRTGTVSVAPGLRTVVIGNLPAGVDPASVRVAARGPGLALLNVEVHRRYRTDPLREETARLRAEAERCRDAVQALDDEDAAVQAGLDFLGHLSADTTGALGRRREISARRRTARRELEAAEQRLEEAEKRAGRPAAFSEVSATLEASAATPAEVELSYHMPGASWRPLYDLTLTGEQLAVSYLAEVTQKTGEDWPAVELVLSTTRRGRHQTLPELDPWYIGRAQPIHHPVRAPAGPWRRGPLPSPARTSRWPPLPSPGSLSRRKPCC